MHPTLMIQFADARAVALRSTATARRGTLVRARRSRFFGFRRPRRGARVATV